MGLLHGLLGRATGSHLLRVALGVLALVAVSALSSHAAVVGFTGPYDISNWTFSNSNGTDGFLDTSNAPTSVLIASGNNGPIDNGANTDFSIVAPFSGSVGFDWSYSTTDGPFWDRFLVGVDGVFIQLTDNNGSQTQSGSYSISLLEGQLLTLRVFTVDAILGRGETTISNFYAVPEPTSMAIFGLGALGFAYRNRRKVLS